MDFKFHEPYQTEYVSTKHKNPSQARKTFILNCIGDHLADSRYYKDHDDFYGPGIHLKKHKGLDSIRYHLMQKHNWPYNTVSKMDAEALFFAIEDELLSSPVLSVIEQRMKFLDSNG